MLSRSEERQLRAAARARGREAEGLFLAEGVRVVEELLAAGIVPRLSLIAASLEDTGRGRALAERLAADGEVRSVAESTMRELAGTRTPQGVLVMASIPPGALDAVQPSDPAMALILDGVQDPGNVGTLARSAAAFGCTALACLPGTVDPWNPKAVRASAGALFRMPVVRSSTEAVGAWLDGHRFTVLGADAAGIPLTRGGATGRVALVVGNEGAGLSPTLRSRCHRLVAVPMRGGTESLNVAVAAAILMYEITREIE